MKFSQLFVVFLLASMQSFSEGIDQRHRMRGHQDQDEKASDDKSKDVINLLRNRIFLKSINKFRDSKIRSLKNHPSENLWGNRFNKPYSAHKTSGEKHIKKKARDSHKDFRSRRDLNIFKREKSQDLHSPQNVEQSTETGPVELKFEEEDIMERELHKSSISKKSLKSKSKSKKSLHSKSKKYVNSTIDNSSTP